MKMCVRHNLPSFRGNRRMLRQTQASDCTVKCSLTFVSPQSHRRFVPISEFGRAAIIKYWRYCQAWRSYSVPFNSVMAVPSTSCIKITHTHTHTSNINCTTSRFIQGPQRPQPSIFKGYTDRITAALCQVLDRVQWWIFMEGTRNKTNISFWTWLSIFHIEMV